MARPAGRRNRDFAESRDALIRRIGEQLVESRGARLSFLQMAKAAGVSVATLKHYFGSRREVLSAVMASISPQPEVTDTEELESLQAGERLDWVMGDFIGRCRAGLGVAHEVGLAGAASDPDLEALYADGVLEPTLSRAERTIGSLMAEGSSLVETLAMPLLPLAPVLIAFPVKGRWLACRPVHRRGRLRADHRPLLILRSSADADRASKR
jgi:AcrR family transcriptional regulator